MKRKGKFFGRTSAILTAGVLFIGMRLEPQRVAENLLNQINMISGYVMKQSENKTTTQNIINCYLPVVGYVESNYVETQYLPDPSYHYETQVEYIDFEEKDEEEKNKTSEEETAGTLTQEETQESQSVSAVPVRFQRGELTDFNRLLNQFYTVTSITELKEDKFDVNAALDADMTIKGDNSAPQILIFHTHSQEGFVDSVEGDNNTTIVGVGARLAEILSSQYGYNVIHDTSVYDYVGGVLDRSKAYTYAEQGIQSILEKYPTVEVVLDIHRDGVREDVRLVTDINGKPTAKMMFFNGISYTKVNGEIEYLQNPYIQDNLAMSLQMFLLGKTYYPDMLRKIYINGYRYCLHFRAKSMLIEVGAQNNTLEEELNAMEPLADMLNRLFQGEKAYE